MSCFALSLIKHDVCYREVVTVFSLCVYDIFNQFPAPVVTPEIVSNEESPSTSQGLPLAPQLPPAEPQLDLEQQWQDIMAIMELQVCSLFKMYHLLPMRYICWSFFGTDGGRSQRKNWKKIHLYQ